MVPIPKMGIGNLNCFVQAVFVLEFLLEDYLVFPVTDFDSSIPFFRKGTCKGNPSFLIICGLDFQGTRQNVPLWKDIEMNRTIDTRATIPTGIRLIGIISNNFPMILTVLYKISGIKIEIGVTIRTIIGFLSVQEDFSVPIDSLELKIDSVTIF